MEQQLAGKVAVITGGARGIGGATATLFARRGAAVVIGDVLEDEGARTVAEIESAGGRAIFVRTDVTQEEQCRHLVDAAVGRFGRLDTLVTCAGVLRGGFVPVDELDAATFRAVMDINVTGTFLCAKYAVGPLRTAGHGVILCLASGAGVTGASSSLAYGSSKAGVHGFVMTLRPPLDAQGIRVHDICPGAISTVMKRDNIASKAHLEGRSPEEALAQAELGLGDPSGVARVLAFLASDDADYVRGTIFVR